MDNPTPEYEVELMDGTVLPIYFTHTTLGLRDEPHPLPIIVTSTFHKGEALQLSAGANEKTAMEYTLYLLGGGPSIVKGKVLSGGQDGYRRLAPIKQVRKLTT